MNVEESPRSNKYQDVRVQGKVGSLAVTPDKIIFRPTPHNKNTVVARSWRWQGIERVEVLNNPACVSSTDDRTLQLKPQNSCDAGPTKALITLTVPGPIFPGLVKDIENRLSSSRKLDGAGRVVSISNINSNRQFLPSNPTRCPQKTSKLPRRATMSASTKLATLPENTIRTVTGTEKAATVEKRENRDCGKVQHKSDAGAFIRKGTAGWSKDQAKPGNNEGNGPVSANTKPIAPPFMRRATMPENVTLTRTKQAATLVKKESREGNEVSAVRQNLPTKVVDTSKDRAKPGVKEGNGRFSGNAKQKEPPLARRATLPENVRPMGTRQSTTAVKKENISLPTKNVVGRSRDEAKLGNKEGNGLVSANTKLMSHLACQAKLPENAMLTETTKASIPTMTSAVASKHTSSAVETPRTTYVSAAVAKGRRSSTKAADNKRNSSTSHTETKQPLDQPKEHAVQQHQQSNLHDCSRTSIYTYSTPPQQAKRRTSKSSWNQTDLVFTPPLQEKEIVATPQQQDRDDRDIFFTPTEFPKEKVPHEIVFTPPHEKVDPGIKKSEGKTSTSSGGPDGDDRTASPTSRSTTSDAAPAVAGEKAHKCNHSQKKRSTSMAPPVQLWDPEAPENKFRMMIWQHAAACERLDGECAYDPICTEYKDLLLHIESCPDDYDCEVSGCRAAKEFLLTMRLMMQLQRHDIDDEKEHLGDGPESSALASSDIDYLVGVGAIAPVAIIDITESKHRAYDDCDAHSAISDGTWWSNDW